jgi:hypothetical protein
MSASYSALANPPNLMSLYLQLQQRQSASDQINRGFALIAANHSAPSMREAIMQSMTGGGQDAGSTVNNLMQLYQSQNVMAAQQQMLGQADAWDKKLGLPPGTSRAEILAGRGPDLVRSMEPTDTMRNYTQAKAMLTAGGMDPAQADSMLQPMLMGAGANPVYGDYMRQVMQAQKDGTIGQHPELMGGFTAWQSWMQAHALGQKDAETNKQEAIKQFPLLSSNLGKYIDTLGDIATDPNLPGLVNHPLVDMSKISSGLMGEGNRGLNEKITGAQALANSLVSKGGALTSANLASIKPDAEALTHYNLTEDQYRSIVLEPQIKSALTAAANNYVAAGKTDQMPGYLRPYADATAQLQPRAGVQPNPKLKQLTDQDIADAQTNIEKYGPKSVIQHLKDEGYDTSRLE